VQTASHDVQPQSDALKSIRGLAKESQEQSKSLQRELGEIMVLIRQTSSEIERLEGRASDAARRLRELETNPDNFSRQEIREIMSATHEAEMRVFVMKGQLEVLEHKRRTLEKMRALLQAILDIGATIPDDGQTTEGVDTGRRAQFLQEAAVPDNTTLAQIMHAQEDERQRIAHRLHDGPAQALTNLILRAEICERMLDVSADQARSELASLREMIANTLQDTRDFIFDLRPMILDDLGLIPTLRRQAEIFSSRSRIPVCLKVSGIERRLPSLIEVIIFRAVQEALDNAAKHGKPSEIDVSVDITDSAIHVAIEDNGVGFDPDSVLAPSSEPKGIGLRRIQEHIASVGGHLKLENSSVQGARVVVQVPL